MFKIKGPNYSSLSDEKLAAAIRNGDSKAFNEIYKRYNERLLYYFYRMLGNNKEIAQDFVQDIFYKVIDKPHLFDSNKRFSTWIFSIAHNMCKNEYRSQSIRTIVEKVDNTDCFIMEDESKTEHPFNVEAVFLCLNDFDETYSTAFVLKYREGLSIEEISTILDLPKGTVKSRLFYMRKKIQEKLMVERED